MWIGALFLLVQCAGDRSREVPAVSIPEEAWRAGDVARLINPLIWMRVGQDAYINIPPDHFDPIRACKPFTRYDEIGVIEAGATLRVERIIRPATPNSVGGKRIIARILDGEHAGKEAMLCAGRAPSAYHNNEFFMVPDPDYFELIAREN